jgi:hypothetical protein
MEAYQHIAVSIIKQQESLIGPLAVERAKQVAGLKIDWKTKTVEFDGTPKDIIDNLVEQYKVLFGQISVEVCKEAAGTLLSKLPSDQVPTTLR